MYEIFPNYFIRYSIIHKKYHLINGHGPENLLHKLTVALALGNPPCGRGKCTLGWGTQITTFPHVNVCLLHASWFFAQVKTWPWENPRCNLRPYGSKYTILLLFEYFFFQKKIIITIWLHIYEYYFYSGLPDWKQKIELPFLKCLFDFIPWLNGTRIKSKIIKLGMVNNNSYFYLHIGLW